MTLAAVLAQSVSQVPSDEVVHVPGPSIYWPAE